MTIAILLVVAAVVCLVFVYLAVSRSRQLDGERSLAGIQPIDIDAFRNLVDPREVDYLRRSLPPPEFRRVQRKRLLAAAAYVRTAKQNAEFLVQVGQAAQASASVDTAVAARHMVDQALRLQRNAFLALLRIRAASLWPHEGVPATPVLDTYDRLTGSAMLLGRLQNPAAPMRITS